MLHDFDVRTFCQNLRATKPPYKCPIADCEKIYKSYSGIQFHLYNFDHDSPNSLAQIPKSGSKPHRKRGFAPEKWHHRRIRNCHSPQPSFRSSGIDSLSYADSQKVVEVKVNGRLHHLNIYEPLEVVSQDGAGSIEQMEKRETVDQMSVKMAKGVENCKPEDIMGMLPHSTTQSLKLPEARFRVLDDYIKPSKKPDHMFSYYRFMEKSMDELDGGVEYDMDEEVSCLLLSIGDHWDFSVFMTCTFRLVSLWPYFFLAKAVLFNGDCSVDAVYLFCRLFPVSWDSFLSLGNLCRTTYHFCFSFSSVEIIIFAFDTGIIRNVFIYIVTFLRCVCYTVGVFV